MRKTGVAWLNGATTGWLNPTKTNTRIEVWWRQTMTDKTLSPQTLKLIQLLPFLSPIFNKTISSAKKHTIYEAITITSGVLTAFKSWQISDLFSKINLIIDSLDMIKQGSHWADMIAITHTQCKLFYHTDIMAVKCFQSSWNPCIEKINKSAN